MKIYFIADLLYQNRKLKAGIYRYTYEIAYRMIKDPRVDLEFITCGTVPSIELDFELENLFGPGTQLYSKYQLFGFPVNDVNPKGYIYNFYCFLIKCINQKGIRLLIILREITRPILKIEEKVIAFIYKIFLKIHIEKEAVIFSPYTHLHTLKNKMKQNFKVRVCHDIIPILFPEYCDTHTHFRKTIYDSYENQDLILTVSENTKKDLSNQKINLDANKIKTVHIAASDKFEYVTDISKIRDVKSKYNIPEDSEYVFSLCTIEPRKNHLGMLEAWSRIHDKAELQNTYLVIGGKKGWNKLFQGELAKQRELSKSVIFTGFIDDEDLPSLYSGSIFSLYPSFYEGFGIPVLESMMCKTFCLTSNISSIPEITGNDVPLLNPHSVDDIVEKILLLINDRKLLVELSEKQHERSKLFSWNKTYEKTIKELKNGLLKKLESK